MEFNEEDPDPTEYQTAMEDEVPVPCPPCPALEPKA